MLPLFGQGQNLDAQPPVFQLKRRVDAEKRRHGGNKLCWRWFRILICPHGWCIASEFVFSPRRRVVVSPCHRPFESKPWGETPDTTATVFYSLLLQRCGPHNCLSQRNATVIGRNKLGCVDFQSRCSQAVLQILQKKNVLEHSP